METVEKTTIEFGSLTELILPEGCEKSPSKLWNVDPSFDEKLGAVLAEVKRKCFKRVLEGDEHAICTPTLQRDFLELVQKQCPPKTANEFALVFVSGGRGIESMKEETELLYKVHKRLKDLSYANSGLFGIASLFGPTIDLEHLLRMIRANRASGL